MNRGSLVAHDGLVERRQCNKISRQPEKFAGREWGCVTPQLVKRWTTLLRHHCLHGRPPLTCSMTAKVELRPLWVGVEMPPRSTSAEIVGRGEVGHYFPTDFGGI